MDKIIEFIDKPLVQSGIESKDVDVLVSRNFRYQGIGLPDCVLILDNKKMTSFRIRLENEIESSFGKITIFQVPDRNKIDKKYLSEYFAENSDNPFALKYVFQVLVKESSLDEKSLRTQFPPLQKKLERDLCVRKFKEILVKVKTGDLIMTYDRTSRVSQYIRKIDGSQWSHCGSMYDDFQIQEMTTGGMDRSLLSLLDPYQLDIAIYRPIGFVSPSQDQIINLKKRHDQLYYSNVKYNWIGIFKVILVKKFPKLFRILRKSTGTTLSDLINSNEFVLIDWV